MTNDPMLSQPKSGNEPELSGQRLMCMTCGKSMRLAPSSLILFCEGVMLPHGSAWVCLSCNVSGSLVVEIAPGIIESLGIMPSSVDDQGKSVYRFSLSDETNQNAD